MKQFDLFSVEKGLVVAPAGCGKTQSIVTALKNHSGLPVLILTHTNAGVAALKARLDSESVDGNKYRLITIDGWILRLVSSFPILSGIKIDKDEKIDYANLQKGSLKIVSSGALDSVI